jgi:3,4-dihydroxy 2-butanone 4-phosphate synthase / GTP cyclohydrolase II
MAMSPRSSRVTVEEDGRRIALNVLRVGVGPLLTKHGSFHEFAFTISDHWSDYIAIVKSDLDQDLQPVFRSRDLLIRIDSGCGTGQVFGDLTCDCAEQLDQALARIAANGEGIVVHVPGQDGRGLGLGFKLATLLLQTELGVDTVEASALLDPKGVARDQRQYAGVIAIVRFFGLAADAPIRLLSNNPRKLSIFRENGFADSRLSAITVPPTAHTRRHLLAKQSHMGHIGLVPDVAVRRQVEEVMRKG